MNKKLIMLSVLLVLLCSCSLKNNSTDMKKSSEEEMAISKVEIDYSNLHETARIYEKIGLGYTLNESNQMYPVFFTRGILHEFNKDADYIKDYTFTISYEKAKEIASLFFRKKLISESDSTTYAYYLDDYKDIILEPFEINDNGKEISVLYGRFIDDEEGNRHWLYPVTYTVVPYILAEDEIPSIFSDELKAGEQRYRIQNVENIISLEEAEKIYSDNGYADLFVRKSYEIDSADDILEMSKRVNSQIYNEINADYTLTKDVDMSDMEFTPIGMSKANIGELDERNPNNLGFCGTFEGNNFTISNLNYVGESTKSDNMTEYFGFFSVLGSGSHIKNLNIENASIDYSGEFSSVSAGILAGRMLRAKVENCNVSGTVKGIYDVGGLVGSSTYDFIIDDSNACSEILNCKADVEVFGQDWIGGFIGSNHRTIITNCFAKGIATCDKITDNSDMPMGIGGFAGHNVWAEIRDCGASVWVKTMVNARCVGSLVGLNEGDIYESFYNSDISNWKPSGDSPNGDLQNDIVGLPNDEYNKQK